MTKYYNHPKVSHESEIAEESVCPAILSEQRTKYPFAWHILLRLSTEPKKKAAWQD
jgi:hypothetical protein